MAFVNATVKATGKAVRIPESHLRIWPDTFTVDPPNPAPTPEPEPSVTDSDPPNPKPGRGKTATDPNQKEN